MHTDQRALRQIALVGDAAWCGGRYCDRGASLAIGGAELLGDALDIFTDTAEALFWWENQMRPVVRQVRRGPRTGGGRVELPEHEKRELKAIEEHLSEEDPEFAARLIRKPPRYLRLSRRASSSSCCCSPARCRDHHLA